jgi:hypothetical protein
MFITKWGIYKWPCKYYLVAPKSWAADTSLQLVQICMAVGHVYYQAEQWVDAHNVYQDALEVYDSANLSGSSTA